MDADCDVFSDFEIAIMLINPCLNIYHITELCPYLYNPLGTMELYYYQPVGAQVYFNRTEVQRVINAPVRTNWEQCNPFVFGEAYNQSLPDNSLPPAANCVLQRVVEYTNNTIIGSGNLDMLIPTNGTLLAIQNMTWNGMRGLQQYPDMPFYVPHHPDGNRGALAGSGWMGYWGTERGLTFYQVQTAGHGTFIYHCLNFSQRRFACVEVWSC